MLLAVETATRDGSIALFGPEGLIEERALLSQDHARTLAPAVREVMSGRWRELSAYALSIGPGSFTGLRIGLAFLKGLAFVYERPLVPVSTLEVIAAGAAEGTKAGRILSVIDARRGEVFAALFESGERHPALEEGLHLASDLPARLAGLEGIVAAGDVHALGSPPPFGAVSVDASRPRAAVLAGLAWPRLHAGGGVDPLDVVPSYLQRTAAEVNLDARDRS